MGAKAHSETGESLFNCIQRGPSCKEGAGPSYKGAPHAYLATPPMRRCLAAAVTPSPWPKAGRKCGPAWGWGKYGQLGLAGDTASQGLPQRMLLPSVNGGGVGAAKARVGALTAPILGAGLWRAREVRDVEGGRWHTISAMSERQVIISKRP